MSVEGFLLPTWGEEGSLSPYTSRTLNLERTQKTRAILGRRRWLQGTCRFLVGNSGSRYLIYVYVYMFSKICIYIYLERERGRERERERERESCKVKTQHA